MDGGFGYLMVEWEFGEDSPSFDNLEEQFRRELIHSDLWEYLELDSYNAIDRGDFLDFMLYHVLSYLYHRDSERNLEGAARVVHLIKNYKNDDGSTPEQLLVENFCERYEARFHRQITPDQVSLTRSSTDARNRIKLWEYIAVTGYQRYTFDIIRS